MGEMITQTPYQYKFIGGRLCLDFCNTGENRYEGHLGELLPDYRGLVAWARQVDLLSDAEAERLTRAADEQPRKSAAVYEQAVTFREALYRLVSAAVTGKATA